MKKKVLPQSASLTELTNTMLTSIMPTSDDPRECLTELGIRPTCAASIVFGMIQKAAKGDTSAAKFVKEMNGEGPGLDETGITDLQSLSDVVLCRLAGFTLEKLMQGEI